MQIIVDDKCNQKEFFDSISELLHSFLLQHIQSYSITSLKYFVIADNDAVNFHNVVNHYAQKLNAERYIDDTDMYELVGKTLEGRCDDGVYAQAIVVKSDLVVSMLHDFKYLDELSRGETKAESNVQRVGLMTVTHELGHVVDNEIIFNQTGTVNLRVRYDLRKKDEHDEFFLQQAISLWSEFFAESFVFNSYPFLRSIETFKNNEILNSINAFRGEGITPIDRAHRILYWFILTIAQNKGVGFDYSVLDGYKQYIDIFKEVERILFDLLDKHPNINVSNDFSGLSKVFETLCVYVQRYGF